MQRRLNRTRMSWIGVAAAAGALLSYPLPALAGGAQHHLTAPAVTQTNLVSDQAGRAAITDPNLVNAWGLSHGPTTPLWVSDNGTDVSTLYRSQAGSPPVAIVPLVVSTPGGAPTGQVFNNTTGFKVPGTGQPALFIFAGEHGDLSAWNGATSPADHAVLVGHTDGAIYKGLALVPSPFGPLLLATDFHNNRIDVFNSSFRRLQVSLLFRDPSLPAGYAPFNVAEIGGRVLVTYAKQDADAEDDVAGAGHGFIDVFTNYGALLKRLVSHGALNSPWGLEVAPSTWGAFAGQLLVGNFGDGRIHVYDRHTGMQLGTLRDSAHAPISIDGLWGLIAGNSATGGPDTIWFSAGPADEAHGLLGTLTTG